MKLLSIFLLMPFYGFAQNNPECDSIFIDCCFLDQSNTDSITLTVTNNSSNLFSYPGFILFDSSMDTVAIETVNYFGIGNLPQQHILNVVSPVTLPFSGYLQLHSGFYDSLHCTFPITIPDPSGIKQETDLPVSIYPNPTRGYLNIEFSANDHKVYNVNIVNVLGEVILSQRFISSVQLNVQDLKQGVYFIQIKDNAGQVYTSKRLLIN